MSPNDSFLHDRSCVYGTYCYDNNQVPAQNVEQSTSPCLRPRRCLDPRLRHCHGVQRIERAYTAVNSLARYQRLPLCSLQNLAAPRPLPLLPEQCQRELPEFRGYAAPSIGVILGVFLVGSTALFCGIAGISIAREYSKESAAARRRDALRAATAGRGLRAAEPSGGGNEDGYLTLAGDTDDEESDDLMGGSINTSTEEEGRAVPKGKRDYGRGGPTRMGRASGSSARRRRRRRAAAAAAAAQLGPSPLARKVSFYTRLLCGTGLAATLIMCGVVVAFAPHAPGVNVCNTEFDWVSDGGRRRGVVAVRF